MDENTNTLYDEMYALAEKVFPITRSLTGDGVRQTLGILREILPSLQLKEVPSGTEAFDWTVPKEWNVLDAYVEDERGRKVIDFKENNLHLVSYSIPVEKTVWLDELQEHLHSLPSQPEAIPYVTSYYKPYWGFCISENKRRQLKPGRYNVVVRSTLEHGSLTYAELLLPGEESDEILVSTYVCHPSMANNEVSGPVVTTFLARWLQALTDRRFTYRIIYIPETIGSIVYLSRHLGVIKDRTRAGFVVTCVGDDRAHSFMPSRNGQTLADRVALHVLKHNAPDFNHYSFLERGSDERQYCSPGVDLPVVSVMRSKYGEYPEYHTSLDDMSLISPEGLGGGYEMLKKCLTALEHNRTYRTTVLCEPQLGKRGLYPDVSKKGSANQTRNMMNIIAYCDGGSDLLDVADTIRLPIEQCLPIVGLLAQNELIEVVESKHSK